MRNPKDPWYEMAIEKQFRPLVNAPASIPATLQYIEDHMDDDGWDEYKDEIIEPILWHLDHARCKGEYAQALATIIGSMFGEGEPLTVTEAMDVEFGDPEDLMRSVLEFVWGFE